jgi:hypothetical protein
MTMAIRLSPRYAKLFGCTVPINPSNKYGAKPTTVDGLRFMSKRESLRYSLLKIRLTLGEIHDLVCQPRFPLYYVKPEDGEMILICTYVADFQYIERGELKIEDAKGMRTSTYVLKKKLFESQYGMPIHEV